MYLLISIALVRLFILTPFASGSFSLHEQLSYNKKVAKEYAFSFADLTEVEKEEDENGRKKGYTLTEFFPSFYLSLKNSNSPALERCSQTTPLFHSCINRLSMLGCWRI